MLALAQIARQTSKREHKIAVVLVISVVVVTVNVALVPVVSLLLLLAGWLAMKGVFMAYGWTGIGTGGPWNMKCVRLFV